MVATQAIHITDEGLVYASTARRLDLPRALELFSQLLRSKPQAATFDALFQGIHTCWALQDDVVNPFGDKREALVMTYTFDLDNDLLLFSNASQNLQIPLRHFREDAPVTIEDFTVFEPAPIPKLNSLAFPSPHWTPCMPLPSRTLPFVSQIMSDFNYQWRHIFRRPYRDITFYRLAYATLSIAMLDFRIVEESSRWLHNAMSGAYVPIFRLPGWQACEECIFRLGRITVVLGQDLERSRGIARSNALEKSAEWVINSKVDDSHIYLLLSVRHIVLCRANPKGDFWCTAPATLLNGADEPSFAGISLLLQALAFAFPPFPCTPIHNLPVELQDQILRHVSKGPIETARLGSLLNLGSPFKWRGIDQSRECGPIRRRESRSHRYKTTPLDSEIWFGDVFSGVVYQ